MLEFPIPHISPLRFVKLPISADERNVSAEIEFKTISSESMLIVMEIFSAALQ